MKLRQYAASLLLALPLFAGCRSDDTLNAPKVNDPMFTRYAALGNSITAGFQSAGINDSTQQRSYARLLSLAMGTPFNYPRLTMPGCPPPFTNNVTQARVGGAGSTGTTCLLQATRHNLLNNLAVPGNSVVQLFNNFGGLPSRFDPLKTIMLGGRTEIEHMQLLKPTFVTVFAGANDVLGALISTTNPGDPAQVTPVATFTLQFDTLEAALAATGAEVMLLGVPDVTVIPYSTKGSTYWCLSAAAAGGCGVAQALPPNLTVNNNCAPNIAIPGSKGDSILVPWPVGIPRVLAAAQGAPGQVIDCSVDADVITASELLGMVQATDGYNTHIQQVAAAHNWTYFDTQAALAGVGTQIPPFPDLSQVATGGSIGFGPLFSLDGIHPSSVLHELIADQLAAAINAAYNTDLPSPVCTQTGGSITCPAP